MEMKWKTDQSDHMKVNTKNGVFYLTYPVFEKLPGFCHGFTTRLGGVSEGDFFFHEFEFYQGR